MSRTNIEWRPVYTLLVILPKRAWVTPYGVWWLLTAPAKGSLLKLSTVETETKTDPRFQEASGRIIIERVPLLVGIYPVSNTYKAGVGRTIRCQNRSGGSGERFTLK